MAYRGRFAPTPSGQLHLGSMLTALASFLQAKAHHGQWLLRIDDLDTARIQPGAVDAILHTLAAFGLESDEAVYYQSQHRQDYEAYLIELIHQKQVYRCDCSRKFLSQYSKVYPRFCIKKTIISQPYAWRLKVADIAITIEDQIQGTLTETLAQQTGDLIVKRRDQIMAYPLTVVIDDYQQAVTEVVRGADLFSYTPVQIYLQQLFNLPAIHYAHLPILVDLYGQKLSKQSYAPAVNCQYPHQILYRLLQLLKQQPPVELLDASVADILDWAIEHWQIHRLHSISHLFIHPD